MRRRKIVSIIGTRPEAIKMAPVIHAIRRRSAEFDSVVLTTAQHREMLDQVLGGLGIRPDIDLNLMQCDQQLGQFASRALASLSSALSEALPDAILIQGDTTTVMTAALAAFYQNIPVGHVEAGLRSFDRLNPYPEEINRRITGCLANLHFAPTMRARRNLLNEGVPEDTVFVTGNTIVDALKSIPLGDSFEHRELDSVDFANHRVILVTAHRRENHGRPLRSICKALIRLTQEFPDVEILYPVHPNPNVEGVVRSEMTNVERIRLMSPLSYIDLLGVMKRCCLILTDSGGIQEEAPSFRKPVLVLRQVTERPEAVEVGAARIVGTDENNIVREASRLLKNAFEYGKMTAVENPFGDGHAAERIVSVLEQQVDAREA